MKSGKVFKMSNEKIDLTVEKLLKNDKFVFNFITIYLYDYINNVKEFSDQNKDEFNKLHSKLAIKQPNESSKQEIKEAIKNLSIISFLLGVVDGFDITNKKIKKEFLLKNFKLTEKEKANEFRSDLTKASSFFKAVKLTNKTLSCEELYNQGNCLIWYALNEETRKNVIKNFIVKDIKENIVKNLKENCKPFIDEQIYSSAKQANYMQQQI